MKYLASVISFTGSNETAHGVSKQQAKVKRQHYSIMAIDEAL